VGDHSLQGVRYALNRLVEQGVVLSERVGNTYTYRFNVDHLAAEPITALARLANTLYARIAAHLGDWAEPPAYAAVFGSAATGTMRPDSDIDLFLLRESDDAGSDDEWDAQVNGLASAVTMWTGNDGRPVVFTTAELLRAAGEPLLADVIAQGVAVYGKRSRLTKSVRYPGNGHTA
jgi:hypothetical protein